MTGEPTFPGEVTEKVSVRQSPIDPPTPVATLPTVTTVPLAGPAMSNVWGVTFKRFGEKVYYI